MQSYKIKNTELNLNPVFSIYTKYFIVPNTNMGIMEFAVVRNNIYKLSVSKISELGHPNDPTNPTDPQEPDPDPVNPPKPDEQNKAYMEVDVQILDWTVRVNDIEF